METQENKRKRPRSDWTVWKRTSVVEIEQNRVITDANVRSRTEPSGSVHWIRQMCRYLRVHHRLLRETSYSLFKTISDTNIEDTAQNKISRESKKYSRERRETARGILLLETCLTLSFPCHHFPFLFLLSRFRWPPVPLFPFP